MSILRLTLCACLLQIFATVTQAETTHTFLCCDNAGNKVCVVSEDGKIQWQYRWSSATGLLAIAKWKLFVLLCHRRTGSDARQANRLAI